MTTTDANWAPLRGIRIIDFGWVISAPLVGMLTAGLGAEVIKIESRQRVDNLRLRGAMRPGGAIDWDVANNAPTFHAINAGKRSFGVNLKSEEGLRLVLQLISTADALFENYTVGALERMGLSDDVLRTAQPNLVRVSLTPAGRTGRLVGMRAYAATTGALAGLEDAVGYPDEPHPTGMLTFGVADYAAGAMAAVALVAAIREAPRRGYQSIDASQVVANIVGLGAGFAALAAGQPRRAGNRHPWHCPHGIYPTADGAYLALAVLGDDEWARLAPLLDLSDPSLGRRRERLARRSEVEQAAAQWVGARSARDALEALHAARLRAAPVLTISESENPYLANRQAKRTLVMTNGKPVRAPRPPWAVEGSTAPVYRGRAPSLGEDTTYICSEILGLPDAAISDLGDRGILDLHETNP